MFDYPSYRIAVKDGAILHSFLSRGLSLPALNSLFHSLFGTICFLPDYVAFVILQGATSPVLFRTPLRSFPFYPHRNRTSWQHASRLLKKLLFHLSYPNSTAGPPNIFSILRLLHRRYNLQPL